MGEGSNSGRHKYRQAGIEEGRQAWQQSGSRHSRHEYIIQVTEVVMVVEGA